MLESLKLKLVDYINKQIELKVKCNPPDVVVGESYLKRWHIIPENKGVPEHEHFDVRYLLLADSEIPLVQNHETNQLKWIDLSEMEEYTTEESLMRMKNKLKLV
jgi:hypothetical protein